MKIDTMFQMPCKDELKDLIIRFRLFDNPENTVAEEVPLNTTGCSIASSGYDGDEEDLGEMMDSDDDEVMAWYSDELEGIENVVNPKETPKNTPDGLREDMERSTPSFLSPSWFQDVVDQTGLANRRSVALGRSTRQKGAEQRECSVGTPAGVHRRPLMDVNNRPHSSGNSERHKMHAQFRPIDDTPTTENMDLNY